MMKLYHGSHNGRCQAHEGLCLVDSIDSANAYRQMNGSVFEIKIDLDGLNVVEVPGYDHDANEAPADNDAFRAAMAAEGADILTYEDEDQNGQPHDCWRLVSAKALAAVASIEQIEEESW